MGARVDFFGALLDRDFALWVFRVVVFLEAEPLRPLRAGEREVVFLGGISIEKVMIQLI